MKPSARDRLVGGLKERRERHQERHRLVRIAAAIGGFLIAIVGLIMIPLPGAGPVRRRSRPGRARAGVRLA
jgi:hypothetical protein